MKRVIPFLLVLIAGGVGATQVKSFPTSPVTQIRMDTYQDGFNTIGLSTWTLDVSTWVVFGSSYYILMPNQLVTGTKFDWSGSSWTINSSTLTLQQYTLAVIDQTRIQSINQIADDDMEQYMVWPDTAPPSGWKGYCLEVMGITKVPTVCP